MKKLIFISLLSLFLFCLSFALTEKELIDIEQRIEKIEANGIWNETIKEEYAGLVFIMEENASGKIKEKQKPFRDRDYVEIGTGTEGTTSPSYRFPYYNYYENSRTQHLYLQSELGAAQTFTKISFDIERVAVAGHQEFTNFTVNFLHTSATAFSYGAYYDMTGATQVFYSVNFPFATTTDWFDIDIDDFAYNGTDNLIVEIIWGDEGAYTSTYYRNYKTASVGAIRTLYT